MAPLLPMVMVHVTQEFQALPIQMVTVLPMQMDTVPPLKMLPIPVVTALQGQKFTALPTPMVTVLQGSESHGKQEMEI